MTAMDELKIRQLNATFQNPPLIVIHGNQTDKVPASYQRYLVNRFREAFDLHGTRLGRDGILPCAQASCKPMCTEWLASAKAGT